MALSAKFNYTYSKEHKYLMQTIDNTNNAYYIIKRRRTSLLIPLVVIFAHHPYLLWIQKGLPLWYMSANLIQTKWKSSKSFRHEFAYTSICMHVCIFVCGLSHSFNIYTAATYIIILGWFYFTQFCLSRKLFTIFIPSAFLYEAV